MRIRSLVERYDTGEFEISGETAKRKRVMSRVNRRLRLGKQMLMARAPFGRSRLCGFVTVTSAGWDMHGNAFGIDDGMPLLGPSVDKSVSAFLEDLEQRGMSDDVLLIITGEFGRTPRINKKGGRDHWGNLCTLAMAGGGLRGGQVIGQSDRTASRPTTESVGVAELMGTVMHTLFNVAELRITQGIPAEIQRTISNSQPIPQLV